MPEPPEIYKQVKTICNQENDPVKRESILERLFKSSLSDKRKWRDYCDLLWEINCFNYERLSCFDPEAERKLFGNGIYPIEKISLSRVGYTHLYGITEPQWVQLWDFDYYEKHDQIIERKVYLHIQLS